MSHLAQITLWFNNANSPQLQKVRFSHPILRNDVNSVRGQTAGAFSPELSGCFKWSSAVKALSILFLRTAALASGEVSPGSSPCLSGTNGSLAASLDFALGKPPSWLQEMFGLTTRGEAIAKRLFCRSNPELKSKGPVVLTVNIRQLPVHNIHIFCDQLKVLSRQSLEDMADIIEGGLTSHSVSKTSKNQQLKEDYRLNSDTTMPLLKDVFRKEALFVLSFTDIFSSKKQAEILKRIYSQPSFNKVCPGYPNLISDIDKQLGASDRLGFSIEKNEMVRQLAKEEPIRVSIACGHIGSAIIFEYLRLVKGYHIEIDYHYLYTIEIMRKMLTHSFVEPPHICLMNVAPTATILAKGEKTGYKPLMLMPVTRHRIIASNSVGSTAPDLGKGEYQFVASDLSSSCLFFEDLVGANLVDRKKVSIKHAEPYESYWALREVDPELRAILFFPFSELNVIYNNCRYLAHSDKDFGLKDFVLFAHESLLREPARARCLDIAIRDAWLDLKYDRKVLERLNNYLLGNPTYMKILQRASGIEKLTTT